MMGPKTLREIREELRRAFGAGGEDPIWRLDQLIADAKRRGEGGVEVPANAPPLPRKGREG